MTSSLGVVDRHGFVVSYVKGQGLVLVFLENGESSRANGHPSVRFNSNGGFGKEAEKVPDRTYSWDLSEIIGGNLFITPSIPNFQDHSP